MRPLGSLKHYRLYPRLDMFFKGGHTVGCIRNGVGLNNMRKGGHYDKTHLKF